MESRRSNWDISYINDERERAAKPHPHILVPARATGNEVHDNAGGLLCTCVIPELAVKVAGMINKAAGRDLG